MTPSASSQPTSLSPAATGPARAGDATSFLDGGGEMAERIRAFDWSKTAIGPIETWSTAARMMVRLMLANPYPMLLWWGPEYVSIYNDAYRPILGTKHPWGLGLPVRECWAEIWHVLQPLIDTPFLGGPATWNEDILLELNRHGFVEEGHFTIGYSPVPDETVRGGIGGVLATVHEITEKVVAERRVALLRDLAASSAEAKSAEEACALAAKTFAAHREDVPFALLYLVDGDGDHARLAGASGVDGGAPISPEIVELGTPSIAPWPAAAALASDSMIELRQGDAAVAFPKGPWSDPPDVALVMRIPSAAPQPPAGFLVLGLSARLRFDERARDFAGLVAAQVAAAVNSARAYEQERKRAEALAELDRAKTAFFSNVSHEFRTPLTLMLGPLEDAIAAAGMPRKSADSLAVAQRNGLRLLRLVNTLLAFSRIEAGRTQARFEPVDLAALTSELASNFRSVCEKAGLRLIVDCWPLRGAPPVFVDRDMWEKIVLNLVSNAFKFTLAGQIDIRLEPADKNVRLTVSDTGVGMPREELPRMFERFHRIEGSRGRTHEGTGIGLALVHELVKLHGGSVTVDSVLGEGSTFTVTIPAGSNHLDAQRIGASSDSASLAIGPNAFVEEALRWLPDPAPTGASREAGAPAAVRGGAVADDSRPGASAPSGTKRARVLWADDNADMRDYVRRLLAGAGFEVEAVADGRAALESARRTPPDVVLADVMMPRLDGYGLLRGLRADPALREVPVILLSARAGEENRIEGIEAGADDYLEKPFRARELLARVATHARMARLGRDARAGIRLIAERERAARDAAEQAGRMKDDFLTTLSHDLRTPLNAILGWTQLLTADGVDAATVQSGIQVIERNARRQANLIADLLDLTRISAGKLALSVSDVDLGEAIAAALDSIVPAADAKGIRVTAVAVPARIIVRADPDRLQQIVSNLLANAVKFTPADGAVQISAASGGGQAEIVVTDTGIGIAPELLPHVFERFRQGDAGSRRHEGLGLGLAIVKHLVEMHGGTASAESRGEGQGATFTVRLPVAAESSP